METLLSYDEIIDAVKGFSISSQKNAFFTSVQTDSRLVTENTLFVPLMGEFQNGHKYIPQAIEKGATVIFINDEEYKNQKSFYEKLADEKKSVLFVIVKNTLHALQNAAEFYVSKFPDLLKIAVTGSSGKTTTKEMLVSVAKAHFGEEQTVYTKGNFNSETGLPLSVFQIRKNHKCGIFEMGMNRENEIGEISAVLKPEFAIITNIGTAHIGILGSRENIAREKRKIFDYIPEDGAAVVPQSDDFADFCTENVKGKIIKFGKSVDEKISGVKFIKDNGIFGTEFSVDGLDVKLPLSGEYNYSNALSVVALARQIGISVTEIKKGLENVTSVGGRMEIKPAELCTDDGKNVKKIVLIKDFYNANPDSMKKGIEFVASLCDFNEKVFVLADMKELGAESKKNHKEIGEILSKIILKNDSAVLVYLIGDEMKCAYDVLLPIFQEKCQGFKKLFWNKENSAENFNQISEDIKNSVSENSVIMFKGSHSMNLELLCDILQGRKNG